MSANCRAMFSVTSVRNCSIFLAKKPPRFHRFSCIFKHFQAFSCIFQRLRGQKRALTGRLSLNSKAERSPNRPREAMEISRRLACSWCIFSKMSVALSLCLDHSLRDL